MYVFVFMFYGRVEAFFTVRLVPYQKVSRTFFQFQTHIEKMWNRFKSGNNYELKMNMGFDPWLADPLSDYYQAAARSIKLVINEG